VAVFALVTGALPNSPLWSGSWWLPMACKPAFPLRAWQSCLVRGVAIKDDEDWSQLAQYSSFYIW